MAATTTNRDTRTTGSRTRVLPMAAGENIPAGVLVQVNAAGVAVNAVATAANRCVGMSQYPASNAAGIAGGKMVQVDRGVFGPFGNSAAADQITLADLGAPCYVVDNQTVAKTSNTGARPVAGTVFGVDSAGVWVEI
ncbi:hypothetical protein [Sphaerotilus sp.]|uniref:hypothetical protein n=1 Tax=Sphaerotilus sp. TaxID=2093942 RepID=UPI00286EA090|nr:hypothetical protein [Sphaerotilus sp.]